MTVHGDDFTCSGSTADLSWLEFKMKQQYEIKSEILGPEKGQKQQVRILNRILTWGEQGIEYEPDQRHAEIAIRELGLEGSNPAPTPGSREDLSLASVPTNAGGVEVVDESPELGPREASRYRGIAARLNYLAQDRADLQYACKEASRRMSKPRDDDWRLLKRIGRYLAGAPRFSQRFDWQDEDQELHTYCDSDWAGCRSTCRSTSGGVVLRGSHSLKTWSSTQATVALSSAEAELYALTKGASQTLGMISLLDDFGVDTGATLFTDASAAIGIVKRAGLGKLRHLNVRYLWLQDAIKQEQLGMEKVHGLENPADLFTKNLAAPLMQKHLKNIGMQTDVGRHEAAPELAAINEVKEDEWYEDDEIIERAHQKPRIELFTPRRVAGAPPCRSLAAIRITNGRYVDTGETFERVDQWTTRSTAHMQMRARWTGTTRFMKLSHEARKGFEIV